MFQVVGSNSVLKMFALLWLGTQYTSTLLVDFSKGAYNKKRNSLDVCTDCLDVGNRMWACTACSVVGNNFNAGWSNPRHLHDF